MEADVAKLPRADRITLAVDACTKQNGMSARHAARFYDVAPSTVSRRRNHAVLPAAVVHQSRQKLSPAEEQLVIRRAFQHYESGLPIGIKHLHQFANEILMRNDPQSAEIGRNWHRKLLARNPTIARILSRPSFRAQAAAFVRKETFEEFFELYKDLRKTHEILSTDIYNMDEKGFMMGAIRHSHNLVPLQAKQAYLQHDGGKEWVSVFECISADGEILPAWVVFKAVSQQNSWVTYLNDERRSQFATSANGWNDNGLGLDWLQEHFHPLTEKRRRGKFRLLILDGHDSHCTLQFVNFCVDNKIILLYLPPHNNHLVRPLDAAVFQPLGKSYTMFADDHSQFCGRFISREDFITYYQVARKGAITSENLSSAWKKTGLFPFNPQEVIHQIENLGPNATQAQLGATNPSEDDH